MRTLLASHDDFQVIDECASGAAALEVIAREHPDVVFLDVEMPAVNGLSVARALKIEPRPFVVFVTAYAQHAVDAFGVEAVDYLLKPFDEDRFEETLHRLRERAKNRQTRVSHSRLVTKLMENAPGSALVEEIEGGDSLVTAADIEINLRTRTVRRHGKQVNLRAKEFDLLVGLVRRAGGIADRKYLLRTVWRYDDDVSSRTVDTHIAELRRKLGHEEGQAGYIQTVLGLGYRLRV